MVFQALIAVRLVRFHKTKIDQEGKAARHPRLAEARHGDHIVHRQGAMAIKRREKRILAGLDRKSGGFDNPKHVRLHPLAKALQAATEEESPGLPENVDHRHAPPSYT